MKQHVSPRTAVITGGNKGIGFEITRAFLEGGYDVFVGARSDNDIVKKFGERVHFKAVDVRREGDHISLAKEAVGQTGRIDVYINCAGFSRWSPVEKIDEEFWDLMIDTNLKGTMWGCKTAAQHLSQGGCIINLGSIAGKRGSANNSVYCASKFGVTGLTQALAKELGPKGIRVNAVCPVLIQTDGLLKALDEDDSPAAGKDVQEFIQQFAQQQSALKRLPTAAEIADMCVFLASNKASAVTGQSFNVDCGVFPQ